MWFLNYVKFKKTFKSLSRKSSQISGIRPHRISGTGIWPHRIPVSKYSASPQAFELAGYPDKSGSGASLVMLES
jgi:hypothetical protein